MKPSLTDRDVGVLGEVYKYRYLSVSQIDALHFPSRQTAYRRLRRLLSGKYLKSFTVPGISERVFYLDKYGAEVVAGEMEVDIDELEWHRAMRAPKDYYFLRHFMAINDFRIALTLACQNTSINLLGFIPEYIGEKTDKGNVKKYLWDHVSDIGGSLKQISHTPDGVFALEKDGTAALFFVEIDRGIEIISDPDKGFLKCVVFYLNYFVDGKWKRYEKDFGNTAFTTFHVLTVTTSQERLTHM